MGFPDSVAVEALVACGRSCCICHKFCGTKMELHHIKQKAYGGEDSFENCIPLCFDCHSDMGSGDPKHPKGKRYTIEELKFHRDNWYKKVREGGCFVGESPDAVYTEDIELFQRICKLFTPSIRGWLIENDLGGAHPYSVFHGLAEYLYGYDDPLSEFIDPEMEKLRGNLVSAISKFLAFKGTNTFPKDLGGSLYCVTRAWMLDHEDWVPHTMNYEECTILFAEEVQKLNDLATDVWDTYCEFARQGRHRLGQRKQ